MNQSTASVCVFKVFTGRLDGLLWTGRREKGTRASDAFEYWASGDGLPRAAGDLMESDYDGMLRGGGPITAQRLFEAYEQDDSLARVW